MEPNYTWLDTIEALERSTGALEAGATVLSDGTDEKDFVVEQIRVNRLILDWYNSQKH